MQDLHLRNDPKVIINVLYEKTMDPIIADRRTAIEQKRDSLLDGMEKRPHLGYVHRQIFNESRVKRIDISRGSKLTRSKFRFGL